MQGWDSVSIESDIELGGTDQTFNNLVGRDLQSNAGQKPQVVMVCPILRGLDGHQKMSKSLGNYIGVTESAHEMFGKTMSIPDELMEEWFTLLTEIPPERVSLLCDPAQTHPREAKEELGNAIVTRFHGKDSADAAAAEFAARFREGQLPSDLETKTASKSPISIIELMREAGFASSNGDARRLMAQGAVSINDTTIREHTAMIEVPSAGDQTNCILKVGKRRCCRLVV